MTKTLVEVIGSVACIEDVVKQYLPLKRGSKSGKTLVGPCPFHKSKELTFHVRKSTQYYECTTCGEQGDVFHFIQNMEGCSFPEAVTILANSYGLCEKEEDGIKKIEQTEEYEVCMSLIAHLQSEYLMILDSMTPFVPEDLKFEEVYTHFEASLAPLILPGSYRYLCNRLVFPVRGEASRLLGFVSFATGNNDFVCIPAEIQDYMLFGYDQAFRVFNPGNSIYLVMTTPEDVLCMHTAGFTNTVGLCGQVLTDNQISILKEFTDKVVIIYKRDIPGQVSTFKTLARLRHEGFTTCAIGINEKYKADDLIKKIGLKEYESCIRQATRIGWLDNLKKDIIDQLDVLSDELEQSKEVKERAQIHSTIIPLRYKLNKIIKILDLYPTKYIK